MVFSYCRTMFKKVNEKIVDTIAKKLKNVPFHSSLSDVALYSLGGLCAVSLTQLFDEDCHREFSRKTLVKILKDLGQPDRTNESMFAILDGEVLENGDVFIDAILKEKCVLDSRKPLVHDMIVLAVSEGYYDARMRVLIKHVAWQLRVTWDDVEDIEMELAETIEYNTYVMSDEETKEKAKKTRNRKLKRYALIGLATVGGGALIGLTGGLAAPLVAAGAGAVIGGAGAAALGSTAGIAIIGSLFGVAGAGLTGYKMKKRVGAIEEFTFEPLTLLGSQLNSHRSVQQLHITIAISGWISSKMHDFRIPWSALAESREQYSLKWESKYLYQMGEAFDYLLQTGINMATTEALKYTILSGLIAAVAWPAALISAASIIDNPWNVCTQRAVETGKQLAEVLLAREQGNRPVTLIGFSLGARVVFSCLEQLSKRKGSEGLVEDAILFGAPVSGDPKQWLPLTKVVAGKIVNGFCRGDWLLKFLYRTASVEFNVAGLSPVKLENKRMHNIDLSDVIDGHGDYIKNLPIVMKAIGIRTKDEVRPLVSTRAVPSVSKMVDMCSQTTLGDNGKEGSTNQCESKKMNHTKSLLEQNAECENIKRNFTDESLSNNMIANINEGPVPNTENFNEGAVPSTGNINEGASPNTGNKGALPNTVNINKGTTQNTGNINEEVTQNTVNIIEGPFPNTLKVVHTVEASGSKTEGNLLTHSTSDESSRDQNMPKSGSEVISHLNHVVETFQEMYHVGKNYHQLNMCRTDGTCVSKEMSSPNGDTDVTMAAGDIDSNNHIRPSFISKDVNTVYSELAANTTINKDNDIESFGILDNNSICKKNVCYFTDSNPSSDEDN